MIEIIKHSPDTSPDNQCSSPAEGPLADIPRESGTSRRWRNNLRPYLPYITILVLLAYLGLAAYSTGDTQAESSSTPTSYQVFIPSMFQGEPLNLIPLPSTTPTPEAALNPTSTVVPSPQAELTSAPTPNLRPTEVSNCNTDAAGNVTCAGTAVATSPTPVTESATAISTEVANCNIDQYGNKNCLISTTPQPADPSPESTPTIPNCNIYPDGTTNCLISATPIGVTTITSVPTITFALSN